MNFAESFCFCFFIFICLSFFLAIFLAFVFVLNFSLVIIAFSLEYCITSLLTIFLFYNYQFHCLAFEVYNQSNHTVNNGLLKGQSLLKLDYVKITMCCYYKMTLLILHGPLL